MIKTILFICSLAGIGPTFASASAGEVGSIPAKEKKTSEPSGVKRGAAVDVMNQQAMTLYNQGAYPKAAALCRQILAWDANHQNAKIWLARSLYRMNKIDASFKIFAELNPKELDVQTVYEYAVTHFARKQYAKALEGFALVAPNDPLFDLASLFGAISAYRLKKYEKAADLIAKAVVLPNHLIKMRARYKAYILENLQKGDKSLAGQSATQQSQFAVDTSAWLAPDAPAAPPPAFAAPPSPPQGGFTTNLAGGYQNKHQASAYGAKLLEGNIYLATASLGGVWDAYFGTKPQAALAPHLSLLTQFDVENWTFDRLDNNPMNDPLTATKNAAIANVRTSGQVNAALFSILPAFTWPVSETAAFSLAMRHTTVLPDFQAAKKATNRSLSLAYQSDAPLGQSTLSVDIFQLGDTHDSPLSTEVRQMARYTFDLPDHMQLFVGAILAQFQYTSRQLDGPDARYGGFGGVQATFPLNITIGGHLLAQHARGGHVYDLPNYNVVIFHEDSTTATGYLLFRFCPWLTALLTGIEQRRILGGIAPAESGAHDELNQKYPTYIRNFDLALRAETSF